MGHIPHSPLRRTINVHWNTAHRHREFDTVYATFANGPPYFGTYQVYGPLSTAEFLIDAPDADGAMQQIAEKVTAQGAAVAPVITFISVSDILAGPTANAGTCAWSYLCWKWQGDGYDADGNKTGSVPDASYIQDDDTHLYGTVGFNGSITWSMTDPGPPPVE